MQSLLKDLAEIRMGLTVRGKGASQHTSEEGLHLLRISDIAENGEITIEHPHAVEISPSSLEKHKLKPGDVILANRGSRMTAAVALDGLEAIASNQLYRLRPRMRRILPEYLRWYLNLEQTQKLLGSKARGSYVMTLSIEEVGKLEIPLPSLERQRAVVEVARLAEREREILDQIAGLRRRYMQATLLQSLNT
ncbi:MAG: restriction endonuclease subunit S [Oceanipulchritudo sp.]